jgi:hypothetical protein
LRGSLWQICHKLARAPASPQICGARGAYAAGSTPYQESLPASATRLPTARNPIVLVAELLDPGLAQEGRQAGTPAERAARRKAAEEFRKRYAQ